MRFLSITWRVFANLATGAVILAMLHAANSRFEAIVASALVLLYLSVISSHMSLGYALSRKWSIDLARHIVLAKALHLNAEIEEEAQKESLEADLGGQVGFWITAGFNMLFGLIAAGNLVYAVAIHG